MTDILLEIKDISLNQNSNFEIGGNKKNITEFQKKLIDYINENFKNKRQFNIDEYRNIIRKFAQESNIQDVNFTMFN